MISIKNVTYKYQNGYEALQDINVDISKGEFICIVGKNGSGKSTFAKVVAGLLKPTKGEVLINNINTSKKESFLKLRENIGIVFQNPENQLVFNNVFDEISFTLKNLKKDNIEQRIKKALEQVSMLDKEKDDIYELSLGQKQRIAIAEVLSFEPKYIVFDEPTTMLDSMGKVDVYNIIEGLKEKGYTIVYITNFADEMLLADRIVILDKGKLVKEILKKDILENIEYLKQYDIQIPVVIELIIELKKKGFNIDKFDEKEIIKQIAEGFNK